MMSVGMPWPEGQGVLPIPMCSGVDEDLRMCSDSDSQLELSELIESITCDDAGTSEGGAVVAGILDCLLDRVEAAANAPARENAQLTAREIDGGRSRDKISYHHEPDVDAAKKLHKKRDHESKRSRRRSTSCSTTSSACSEYSRKHRRKHKHHRRKEEDPSPRVNPIFLWVKQDDTRIVEVLCEDYDKRNRIRLTKTAHGWRAMPRTERLDSALSRSSLDISPSPTPTVECSPSLVSHPQTKEKKKTKRCVSRKSKRCDRKKDKGFKQESYVDVYKSVDVVNNNNCNISNNNNNDVENRVASESSISDPKLRSFGYKKACHKNVRVGKKKRDNKLDDIDVYTFVDTPKTDSDVVEEDVDIDCEPMNEGALKIKEELESQESDTEINNGEVESRNNLLETEITNSFKFEPNAIKPENCEPVKCKDKFADIKECSIVLKDEFHMSLNSSMKIENTTTSHPIDNSKTPKECDYVEEKKDSLQMGKIKPIPPMAFMEDKSVLGVKGKPLPSMEERSVPFVEEKSTSAAEEKSLPSIKEKLVPFVEEKSVPFLEEKSIPTVEERSIPAVEEKSIPAAEEKSISVVKEKAIPAEEEMSIPAEEEMSIPAEEVMSISAVDEKSLPSMKENSATSVEEKCVLSVEEKSVSSVEEKPVGLSSVEEKTVILSSLEEKTVGLSSVEEMSVPSVGDRPGPVVNDKPLFSRDHTNAPNTGYLLMNDQDKINTQILKEKVNLSVTSKEEKVFRELCEPTGTTIIKIPCLGDIPKVESSSCDTLEERKSQQPECNIQEGDMEEEQLPEVILPEPHLHTPEPSPQPVPEPSSVEPESNLVEMSLQPDTSLDSDTIHLPDTTTKSESSSLISTDISLGQKLSIPKVQTELSQESTTLDDHLHSEPKCIIAHSHLGHEALSVLKTPEMIRQEEIERQITADLDEDHLLAIEEILQGEECVEDFSDDDLPEEYSVSHGSSPVNLVIDLKHKDQVDNRGIPLSLRTDDFLELLPTPPPPIKDQPDLTSSATVPSVPKKKEEKEEKKIPHAHQQNKTKFLESILSCPKRSHKDIEKADSSDQQEPLYLGVSRKSASPTVSSSDSRKFSSPDLEPKPKRIKVEDITLKTILNRNKETYTKPKPSKAKDNDETLQTADSTTKSRLLELLTNENDEHISKMDPLTQLKEVLSDPDLNVPDPLLVPRARLAALVANPAKEIPRLLAMKSENLYPKLLTDPDLLVVSLSHLQSLLQAAGKEEEILKYQQQAQMLQQHMKQEQATLDAATATALNQMMWLPYLSQLEAAAVACGNTQDFMTMLNMVFPSGTYPQMGNPYLMPTATSPGINAYDYKSQLEFQQAFALWNEAMMQAATNQFAAQSLATTNSSNISKLYQNYQESKYNPKTHTPLISKHQESKHTAARTSPISQNYQQNKYRSSSQYPYTSMFSIPTSTPTTTLSSVSSQYKTTPSIQSQSYTGRQRGYNYNGYSALTPSVPKSESSSVSALSSSELFIRNHQQKQTSSVSSNNCTKAMMNFLSKPKQPEVKSHISKAYPTSTTMLPKETTIRMTSQPVKTNPDPPKLKVKQPQHLVDPHSRPKLLNFDEHGEVGSTTGSLTPQVDESHPNLWHPLFSSQQKSYSSPWQWTTPVTVAGE